MALGVLARVYVIGLACASGVARAGEAFAEYDVPGPEHHAASAAHAHAVGRKLPRGDIEKRRVMRAEEDKEDSEQRVTAAIAPHGTISVDRPIAAHEGEEGSLVSAVELGSSAEVERQYLDANSSSQGSPMEGFAYVKLSNGGPVGGTSTNCATNWYSWDLYELKAWDSKGAAVSLSAHSSSSDFRSYTKQKAVDRDVNTLWASHPQSTRISSNCWSSTKVGCQWIVFGTGGAKISKMTMWQEAASNRFNIKVARYQLSNDARSWTAPITVHITNDRGENAPPLFMAARCSDFDCGTDKKKSDASSLYCGGTSCKDSDKDTCCDEVTTTTTTTTTTSTTPTGTNATVKSGAARVGVAVALSASGACAAAGLVP